jgi:hypothetical protein
VTSLKFLGILSMAAVVAASSAHAEPRKKGGSRAKSKAKDSSSLTLVPPPSSLVESSSPPVSSPPPPPPDAKPATPSEPPPAAAADSPPDTDADSDKPRPALLPLVMVGAQPQWEGRIFRQSEASLPDVRKYGALGYPSVALTAEINPLANSKSKFLRGLGVTLQFARAFDFQSDSTRLGGFADPNTMPVDTSFMRYAAGLRYRIHTNPESEMPFVLGISASLRRWSFAFATEPMGPDVEAPTANYRLLRFGLDGGLEIKRVTLYAAAYYLHGLSIGAPNTREVDAASEPYLGNAPGMGGEFRGAIGVRLSRLIELRATVEYAIMAYHLRTFREGDPPDQVLDSYLSAGLGPYVGF